jgi:hypothetical protein
MESEVAVVSGGRQVISDWTLRYCGVAPFGSTGVGTAEVGCNVGLGLSVGVGATVRRDVESSVQEVGRQGEFSDRSEEERKRNLFIQTLSKGPRKRCVEGELGDVCGS